MVPSRWRTRPLGRRQSMREGFTQRKPEPWGTLWVMSHYRRHLFDAEDRRILTSLANFTCAALTMTRANADAEARAAEAEAVRNALALAEARKDDFIALLSHELRNPLAPIDSGLAAARKLAAENPDVLSALDIVARQTRLLKRLVSDLLDASRKARQTFCQSLVRVAPGCRRRCGGSREARYRRPSSPPACYGSDIPGEHPRRPGPRYTGCVEPLVKRGEIHAAWWRHHPGGRRAGYQRRRDAHYFAWQRCYHSEGQRRWHFSFHAAACF